MVGIGDAWKTTPLTRRLPKDGCSQVICSWRRRAS
ncbi:unnamed protein product [Acanthoscelides obtectus]|uniref:Uncharacterized protein n=1 Tax=Acanthoscelides obtectus TaxID=200917 RepID=A0A9P0QHL4_ACAOB|nr:unnamed protein product [Acanthoscelides obtectus]CAK1684215.1 hypothetical protein AOBTE_LOCUS34713 [Acanthoscelides obtectus]